MDLEIPRPTPLLGSWLTAGQLGMIHAPAGVGKSWFAYGLGLAVAGGADFLGWTGHAPRQVLYVDGEMSQWDIQGRMRMLTANLTPEQREHARRNFALVGRDMLGADADKFPILNSAADPHRKSLDTLIREDRPAVVILDNLSCLTAMEDENSAAEWGEVISWVLKQRISGRTVIQVQHNRKGGTIPGQRDEAYRGSTRQEAPLSWRISLSPGRGGGGTSFGITFPKRRGDPSDTAPRTATVADGGWTVEVEDPGAELAEYMAAVVGLMTTPTPAEAKARLRNKPSLLAALKESTGEEFTKQTMNTLIAGAVRAGLMEKSVADVWAKVGNPTFGAAPAF